MSHSTPHLVPFPRSLYEGQEIVVEGVVSPHAKRVTVSLVKENDCSHETPLTFDARIEDNVIVRNHHHNGWGSEERGGGCPIKKGERVKLKIVVRNDAYQIFINEQHFCDFKHRIGKEEARNVLIAGDITIEKVNVSGSGSDSQHNNPPVPLTVPIEKMHSGSKIVIAGVPTGGQRFSVNLCHGPTMDNDVALHFDVRFNFGSCHNKIVLNHKSGGNWGSEQTPDKFPFQPNTPFEIEIKVKDDAIKINVNGEKCGKYHLHDPLDFIKYLHVQGDVKLTHVKV